MKKVRKKMETLENSARVSNKQETDEEKTARFAQNKKRRLYQKSRAPINPPRLSTAAGQQDEHDFWLPRKHRKRWVDLKSVPINRDRFWKDHDDNADHFKTEDDIPWRYKPQIIESDQNPWKFQGDFGGAVRRPKFQLQPMWVQRTVHKLYTNDPNKWTPQRLSSDFGIAVKQVKRYIQNVDLEIEMTKRGQTVDDSLQDYMLEIYRVPDQAMVETRTFLTDVYSDQSRQFGYEHRHRLFGSTEDDILQRDLGVKKPRLRLREEPKCGPGSGKRVATANIGRRKQNLAIIDITNVGKRKRNDIFFPATIRMKSGELRYPNIAELSWIRRKEIPLHHRGKFSPH